MQKLRKKLIIIAPAAIILIAVFIFGLYLGYNNRPAVEKINFLLNKETLKPNEVDFSPFWTAWDAINKEYVSKDKIDSQKMVWGAIEGLVGSLGDPYSTFFPPAESKMFQEDMSGNFEGVGMEIAVKNGVLTVVAPLKNTPAYRAGIKSGDKIIEIDDKPTAGLSSEEAAHLIRGPKGTEVKLTIAREKNGDEPMEIKIIRDVIIVPTLETEKKENGIFVIKLYNFSAIAPNSFRDALREFIESGSTKLILDLRDNPGGYMEASIDIASWFLPMGKTVVVEMESGGAENVFRSKGYDIFQDLPMVILVNKGSASASEILAGALQEHGIAKLVGEKTYGKGSVQKLVTITANPETSLKITIAKWLTPNGRSISDEGLEPDYAVELTEKDAEKNRDPQMNKAVELLSR